MRYRWYMYWISLISALFGLLLFKNKRNHSDKSWHWNLGKSTIECILLVLAAAFMPAILVVYAANYFTLPIEKPAYKIGLGFIIGTTLMACLAWALEILVIVGVFAIDLLSDTFLTSLKERREKRDAVR